MLVKILQFGTSWWSKGGPGPAGSPRYPRRDAYFNSTGVTCGKKIRHHWTVRGLLRFNATGDFNPRFPSLAIGRIFECAPVTFAFGGRRLLMERQAHNSAAPEWYLVVAMRDRHGKFDFASADWISPSSVVLAASELREQQEAMLLLQPGDWVRSHLGIWQLRLSERMPYGAWLELTDGPIVA